MYQIVNYYQENNQKILDCRLMSRFLWDDHIVYTRNVIISVLAKLPDSDAVSQRLIKNQEDIGAFMSPYYSTDRIITFVNLLKQHITIAADVINSVEGSKDAWRMNGNDIVNYLYQLNRMFWPISVTGPMWTKHLDLTIAQVDARKNSMWDNDVAAYDENHTCMSEFADVISNGIIYQNMDMFCSNTRI